jgi:replicative DNA helicase
MPTLKKPQPKLPPQNLDAEAMVLGSILIDKNAIFQVADILTSTDFYSPQHEKIFDAIMTLYERRQPIDVMTLTTYLKEKDDLASVGGSSYLADLTNQVTTASHVAHYANIVKEKKTLRDLIKAAAEITEMAFVPKRNLEDLMDEVEQKILTISEHSLPQNFAAVKDELKSAYERMEKLHAGGNKIRGVPTGFSGLDTILSGLQKSELVVLGARPSVGKTSLALDIARQAAATGATIGLFSLEMSREQIVDRVISAASNVPLWHILTGRIEDDTEFAMIQNGLEKLSSAKIFIDDSPSLNVIQMRSMARRLQVEHGLDLLIVDYLQLIRPRTSSDNVVSQVTEISRGLKALARELKTPVLALSQLSRGIEQRGGMPRLSDLRESGSIEQDADVVMFLYRKDRDTNATYGDTEEGTTQVIVAKHRNGALGTIDLKFDAERATFKTIDKRYASADALPPL